jgi:hypothetical protein
MTTKKKKQMRVSYTTDDNTAESNNGKKPSIAETLRAVAEMKKRREYWCLQAPPADEKKCYI